MARESVTVRAQPVFDGMATDGRLDLADVSAFLGELGLPASSEEIQQVVASVAGPAAKQLNLDQA